MKFSTNVTIPQFEKSYISRVPGRAYDVFHMNQDILVRIMYLIFMNHTSSFNMQNAVNVTSISPFSFRTSERFKKFRIFVTVFKLDNMKQNFVGKMLVSMKLVV